MRFGPASVSGESALNTVSGQCSVTESGAIGRSQVSVGTSVSWTGGDHRGSGEEARDGAGLHTQKLNKEVESPCVGGTPREGGADAAKDWQRVGLFGNQLLKRFTFQFMTISPPNYDDRSMYDYPKDDDC